MEKAWLVLSDGTAFEGRRFGAQADAVGELVFTTNMCGYLETLTDPSYWGQIVMQTFPLIGNYGVIEPDFEGECRVKGYVVRHWCPTPSNFRSQYDLDALLRRKGVPGIWGIDTREVTRIIRERGVTNAVITGRLPADLGPVRAYRVEGAVKAVTRTEPLTLPAAGEQRFHVALLDYGAKANIARELQKRGCRVTILPAAATAGEILALGVDGLLLSNGPGDPAENTGCIAQLALLLGRLPIFGICLGHQLLALAAGGRTVKLKYGHRGANQPARDLVTGRTYMTSQNHGYAVVAESVPGAAPRFVNANDGTCEGLDYPGKNAFTVQFHPEACAGPRDTGFLFDRFIDSMKGGPGDAS